MPNVISWSIRFWCSLKSTALHYSPGFTDKDCRRFLSLKFFSCSSVFQIAESGYHPFKVLIFSGIFFFPTIHFWNSENMWHFYCHPYAACSLPVELSLVFDVLFYEIYFFPFNISYSLVFLFIEIQLSLWV